MGETNIPVQELWLKMGGGLMCEGGGVWAGFYGTKICIVFVILCFSLYFSKIVKKLAFFDRNDDCQLERVATKWARS